MQIHAIAPELVAEAIARLAGVQCGHAERRTKRPTTVVPAESLLRTRYGAGTHPRPRANTPNRHEALEYLASALATPSLADDPRVAGIVRESTDQGKTVVSFLLHVMHGVVRGFRTNNRMEAAKELIGYIARDELARSGSLPAEPVLSPAEEPALSAVEASFPSRACPVLDTGREPIPGSVPSEADLTVIPAESGIQGPGDGDEADDLEDQRGSYDIDRKIAVAQQDPAHPIHKFVQAFDEVAAAFHGKDKENDDDEEVRYWISGEVPDAYGKYIWEYAPAYPRSIRRRLRPKRRRRSTPKAESVWMKRPTDKLREAGIPRPNRFKVWV